MSVALSIRRCCIGLMKLVSQLATWMPTGPEMLSIARQHPDSRFHWEALQPTKATNSGVLSSTEANIEE